MRFRLLCVGLAVVGWAWLASEAGAHVLNITRVRVAFDDSSVFRAEIAIDLTTLIGTGGAYYEMSILPPDQQAAAIRDLVPRVLEEIQFHFGGQRVVPILKSWKMPAADRATYEDYYVGKMTVLEFEGAVPPGRPPFRLVTGELGGVEYPLAYTCERPDRGVQRTRFLEIATQPSEPFDYDTVRGEGVAAASVTPPAGNVAALPGADMSAARRYWLVQAGTLWRYLKLGFDHIIPDGADHILFVLGLFFFGLSWRKLLSQTTVFTVAHATTLYLSSRGIFSLPAWLVDPGIALSIAFIAFENIFRPRLSVGRLAVVFFFGLVHGLGFASGLKALALPKREFLVGLLGFNFGVDAGQLFVIGLAFLFVGWMRREKWYTARVAVPASALIGLIGAYWTVERIIYHVRLG